MTLDDISPVPTRTQVVASRLRQLIQSGELPPGSVLLQTNLAQKFGVSTTPVREAFSVLMREGLVVQDAHRSVRVFQPSVEELMEIYEIRRQLEPFATELATSRATTRELDGLSAILDRLESASEQEAVELNGDFHAMIDRIAGRPRLAGILESLRATSASYLRIVVPDPGAEHAKHVLAQHRAIVEAMRNGNERQAAALIREHLDAIRLRLEEAVSPDRSHVVI